MIPNHLLFGRPTPIPPDLSDVFTDNNLTAKQRWRIAQAVVYNFWMREVLTSLTKYENDQERPNLEVGDIVVNINPATPRETWQTRRIVQTFPGHNGVVCCASILTNGAKRHRPSHVLFFIDSVQTREGAHSTAVTVVVTVVVSKTVSFNLVAATPREE